MHFFRRETKVASTPEKKVVSTPEKKVVEEEKKETPTKEAVKEVAAAEKVVEEVDDDSNSKASENGNGVAKEAAKENGASEEKEVDEKEAESTNGESTNGDSTGECERPMLPSTFYCGLENFADCFCVLDHKFTKG